MGRGGSGSGHSQRVRPVAEREIERVATDEARSRRVASSTSDRIESVRDVRGSGSGRERKLLGARVAMRRGGRMVVGRDPIRLGGAARSDRTGAAMTLAPGRVEGGDQRTWIAVEKG